MSTSVFGDIMNNIRKTEPNYGLPKKTTTTTSSEKKSESKSSSKSSSKKDSGGGYDKGATAKALGMTRDELTAAARKAGYNNSQDWVKASGGVSGLLTKKITDQITKQIIDLDRQLDNLPGISLTDAEKQNFLDKAIAQVQPYYDRKTVEINKGIQEGKLRSAEDILLYTRDTENEIQTTLANLDLSQAQTEEEFINRLADITASADENIAVKQDQFRYQMEALKMNQIQSGIFSSGIGEKKRQAQTATEALAEKNIQNQSLREQTAATTAEQYSLEQIRLAREAAARDRAARIGAPDQAEQMKQQQLGALGLTDMSQLGSRADIEAARAQDARNVTTYKPEALTTLEEQRLKDVEATKQELQQQELDVRNQEYEKQRQKILSAKGTAQAQLAAYKGY
jgi:hypothetical protein